MLLSKNQHSKSNGIDRINIKYTDHKMLAKLKLITYKDTQNLKLS